MRCIVLDHETDLAGWRAVVRPLLAARVPTEELGFRVGVNGADLFSDLTDTQTFRVDARPQYPVKITKAQMALCERVLCHRAPERLHYLYDLILHLQTDPHALDNPTLSSAVWVKEADKSVRRDRHKMNAFVRFRKVGERTVSGKTREVFCAWFEPEHRIVALTSGFFMRRFTGMDWSILTPEGCAHWDGETLSLTAGVDKAHAPTTDTTEEVWKTYYSSIFNPSRVKIGAMMAEMPKKYWHNLPEAELIPQLIKKSEARRAGFLNTPETTPNAITDKIRPDVFAFQSGPREIETLADAEAAAARCTNCALHRCATQTVWGQGPADADIMLVGEQPGDQEDIIGTPFIGPAGQLLDKALREAELNRDSFYITNAVKHFKFEARGKFRQHRTPVADEIERCKSWLEIERSLVKPRVILALGKTAMRSLTGHSGTLKSVRGQILEGRDGEAILATVHPSFLLRIPVPEVRQVEYRRFVADLRQAKALSNCHQSVRAMSRSD